VTGRGAAISSVDGQLTVYNAVFYGNRHSEGYAVQGGSIWGAGLVQASYSCFLDIPETSFSTVYYRKIGSYPTLMDGRFNW
jgi:hypothetical protein